MSHNFWIYKLLRFILTRIVVSMGQKSRKVLNFLASALPHDQQVYVTYHMRPKRAAAIHTKSDLIKSSPRLAVILQGPIMQKDDFTLETINIYKKHFEGNHIILSTWSDEAPEVVEKFRVTGVEVLLNEKPAYAGEGNINLQIVSSKNGVLRAGDLGDEYVLKTRTDQRLYAPNVMDFLHNVIEVFPASIAYPKQRKRIVGASLNTFKYRMYGLSDTLIYGHIEDMILFWDVDIDQRVFNADQRVNESATLRSFAHMQICEVYLATEFLKKVGRNLEWSLTDSWSAFSDHFCIVDKEQLDLYWPKYMNAEYRYLHYSEEINVFEELTFREWLNLYANLANKEVPERILDYPFYKD